MNGQTDESMAQFQKTLERGPNFQPALYKVPYAYAAGKRFDEAIEALKKAENNKENWPLDGKVYTAACENLLSACPGDWRADTAYCYATAGEREKAMQLLEEAYNTQESEVLAMIGYSGFAILKSGPRYNKLMQNLNLPE